MSIFHVSRIRRNWSARSVDGVGLLTWEEESFAYADSFDEATGRYRGLRGGQLVHGVDANSLGLLVKGSVARSQIDGDSAKVGSGKAIGNAGRRR